MTEIGANRYGKEAIRLVKVDKRSPEHEVRDLTVDIALEGDFASSYTDGDNSLVIATDTMKNTVYALAPEHLTGPIEAFGLVLAEAMACGTPAVGYDGGATPELIDRPGVGLLFDRLEPRALADAILAAFELSAEPETAGRCRDRATEFSAERFTTSYLELYASLGAS